MDLEFWEQFFCWASLINVGVLCVWFMILMFTGDQVYRFHQIFFSISRKSFQTIQYALMGAFKLIIMVFNVVPWVVLKLM